MVNLFFIFILSHFVALRSWIPISRCQSVTKAFSKHIVIFSQNLDVIILLLNFFKALILQLVLIFFVTIYFILISDSHNQIVLYLVRDFNEAYIFFVIILLFIIMRVI